MEHVDVQVEDGIVLFGVHRPQHAGELREGLHQFAKDAIACFNVLVAHGQQHHALAGGRGADQQGAQEPYMGALVVEA